MDSLERQTLTPPHHGRPIDCVVLGSCVIDLPCGPFDLDRPIGHGALHPVAPIVPVPGGLTANAGLTLARMGRRAAVVTRLGDDPWAPMLKAMLGDAGVDTTHVEVTGHHHSSATVVVVDPGGERSFFHCAGAHRTLTAEDYLGRLDLFTRSRAALWGYYPLSEAILPDLPRLFAAIRAQGCWTAMDASGDGGLMDPLDRILPHLDVYVPSFIEAAHQTGLEDPEKMLAAYLACGVPDTGPGVRGVKLGERGALLGDASGAMVHVDACTPPGPVVDTTGAGDAFYAGLIAGLLDGLPLSAAGRLGCAAGACCVTARGGSTGARSMEALRAIAALG